MATLRSYTGHPTHLTAIAQGRISIKATDNALVVIFDSPDATLSLSLAARDIREILPQLAAAIAVHSSMLHDLER